MKVLTVNMLDSRNRQHISKCVVKLLRGSIQCRVRMAMTTHQATKCQLRICMLIEGGLHACVDMSGPSDCF